MATDKQVSFVTSLVRERWQTLEMPDQDTAVRTVLERLSGMDTRNTSQFIDRIKNMPKDAAPNMPEVVAKSRRNGTNSRDGKCEACGHIVKAEAGFYYDKGTGWGIHHKVGECITDVPAPVAQTVSEGFYVVGDKTIMVYLTGNKRLAGKVLVGKRWKYEPGAVFQAALGHRMTADEAAAYGHRTGKCIVCGIVLEDEGEGKSVDRGYGPVCAKNNGWPWG